ncbi:hypothetical protein KQX54_018333 [Cotesia glomerata]|uniref:Uncharacterized protein n=1 Tax=Cotesia glomerata TaxID=32391 RepID=A0AAV7I6D3_COTGL|nr:hypothetical protein KQX54_018333 [Cotesia glomerata]
MRIFQVAPSAMNPLALETGPKVPFCVTHNPYNQLMESRIVRTPGESAGNTSVATARIWHILIFFRVENRKVVLRCAGAGAGPGDSLGARVKRVQTKESFFMRTGTRLGKSTERFFMDSFCGFGFLDLESGVGLIPSFGFVPLLVIQVNSDWSAGSRLDRRLAVDGPLGPIKLMVTRAGNSLRSVCRKPARASRRPKLFSCLT